MAATTNADCKESVGLLDCNAEIGPKFFVEQTQAKVTKRVAGLLVCTVVIVLVVVVGVESSKHEFLYSRPAKGIDLHTAHNRVMVSPEQGEQENPKGSSSIQADTFMLKNRWSGQCLNSYTSWHLFGGSDYILATSECGHPAENHQFAVVPSKGNRYSVRSGKLGVCIDDGGGYFARAAFFQHCDESSESQMWALDRRSDQKVDGFLFQLRNHQTGRCLYNDPNREMHSSVGPGNTNPFAAFETFFKPTGPGLGVYDCMNDVRDQQWFLLTSKGELPSPAMMPTTLTQRQDVQIKQGTFQWKDCESIDEHILETHEISTSIGGTAAKHRLVVLKTAHHTLVTELKPRSGASGSLLRGGGVSDDPNVVRCVRVDDNPPHADFVVNKWTNVSESHSCGEEQHPGKLMTLHDLKKEAEVFLHWNPGYGLLRSNCQSYSSWVYHLLTGCDSATQSERADSNGLRLLFTILGFLLGYGLSLCCCPNRAQAEAGKSLPMDNLNNVCGTCMALAFGVIGWFVSASLSS